MKVNLEFSEESRHEALRAAGNFLYEMSNVVAGNAEEPEPYPIETKHLNPSPAPSQGSEDVEAEQKAKELAEAEAKKISAEEAAAKKKADAEAKKEAAAKKKAEAAAKAAAAKNPLADFEEETGEESPAEEVKDITIEMCKKIAGIAINEKNNRDLVVNAFASCGVKSFASLPKEKFAEFYHFIESGL